MTHLLSQTNLVDYTPQTQSNKRLSNETVVTSPRAARTRCSLVIFEGRDTAALSAWEEWLKAMIVPRSNTTT
jgi:hypothetical protein